MRVGSQQDFDRDDLWSDGKGGLFIQWPHSNEREDATLYVYRLRCGMWWRRLKG
jgi:hypothetical protein